MNHHSSRNNILAPNNKQNQTLKSLDSVDPHFSEINGFCFKTVKSYNHENSHVLAQPSMLEITPTKSVGQVSVSVPRWKMAMASVSKVEHTVCECASGKLTFAISQRPTTFSFGKEGQKSKIFDLRGSNEDKPLGWIKFSNELFHGHVIMTDYESQNVLIMEAANDHFSFMITDLSGDVIATAQPKKGMRKRSTGLIEWTDWKLKYAKTLPTPVKSLAMAAVIMKINVYNKEHDDFKASVALGKR